MPVTLPLDPTVIKLTTGERAIIDYSKRFTLAWDQELAAGQGSCPAVRGS
jgi:hypothetical protein